jgi:perosamine synthetase
MIPLMKVHMPPPEKLMPALQETLYSGMVTEGVKVKEFEEALQKKFDLYHRPLSVNSGTAALQLAYRASGVRGKIVLATPMTCTATNMPILAEGGKIVWCDIDPETGNIDVKDVVRKLEMYGSQVAAVSFVDFAGYPANLEDLSKTTHFHNVASIQDSAQSLGAKWNGWYVGNHSDFVCFSFQAIKHLTTVDGGALAINKVEKIWKLVKKLKWYGIDREAVKEATRWHYDILEWGYKAHMNNVNATIGLAQLDYIDSIVAKHVANGKFYDKELQGVSGLSLMKIPALSEPSYWIYMIKVERREEFAKMMAAAGIGVNVAHIRNDQYTCFKDTRLVANPEEHRPGLEEFNNKYIAIPCGWWVTEENRQYIVDTIKRGW